MKRGKSLKRKTSLKSAGNGLKRSRLNQRSEKRTAFTKTTRIPMIEEMVEAGRKCEVGPLLIRADIPGARMCSNKIEGLHERRKRSSGGSLTNPANLIPSCILCNGLIETEPMLVRERLGSALVVREGDPEWESLGASSDA